MRRALYQVEDPYWATMLTGSSASDVAISTPDIHARDLRVLAGLDMRSGVFLLSKPAIQAALDQLDEVFTECSRPNWDGYGAQPVQQLTYETTRELLERLPTKAGTPEIGADPDGELVLEWRTGKRKLLSISIALNGRLSFIYRNGSARLRDTMWTLDGQWPIELLALIEILKR